MKELSLLIENNTLDLPKCQKLIINHYSLIYMCDHYYQVEHFLINKGDLLNKFIVRQLKKKQERESSVAQSQMAQQQMQEYGGVAPTQQTQLPNNNNNNI
jgi:hypothetical protein